MGTLFSRTTDIPPLVEKEKMLDKLFKVGRTIGHNEFYKVKLGNIWYPNLNEGDNARRIGLHKE